MASSKWEPSIQRLRKEIALTYRKMRKERPEMARLMFKRSEACRILLQKRIAESIFNG